MKTVSNYIILILTLFYALTVPAQDTLFTDNFENGTSNWIITNDGGDCTWEIIELSGSNYILPPNAAGFVFSADANLCGSNTSTITTATLLQSFFINGCPHYIVIEFDSDWQIMDAADEAYVEVSGDGGISWQLVWSRVGVSDRNSHEFIAVPDSLNPTNFLLRFRTIQPGWDWWWAIDNVTIWYDIPLTILSTPTNLQAISVGNPNAQVNLSWEDNSTWELGYRIERKPGDSLSTNSFSVISEVGANITNYTDTTVLDSTVYTYRVQAFEHPLNTSCYSNLATVLTIIPVELISFEANILYGYVKLGWSTATETNNLGFYIERDTPDQDKWKKISFVPGHGTTTEEQHYSFIDESTLSSTYQYRLKQIDYDGSYEYSNIIEVEVGLPAEFSLEQNYPNPFNPNTTIKYDIPSNVKGQTSNVRLMVFDVLGNEVATLVNEEKKAGIYEVDFDAAGFTSGIYYYRLTAGEFTDTKKMIVLK